MTRRRKRHTTIYKMVDIAVALLAWVSFFVYRSQLEGKALDSMLLQDPNFWL